MRNLKNKHEICLFLFFIILRYVFYLYKKNYNYFIQKNYQSHSKKSG